MVRDAPNLDSRLIVIPHGDLSDRIKESCRGVAKDASARANTLGGLIVRGVHDVQEEAHDIKDLPVGERERQRLTDIGAGKRGHAARSRTHVVTLSSLDNSVLRVLSRKPCVLRSESGLRDDEFERHLSFLEMGRNAVGRVIRQGYGEEPPGSGRRDVEHSEAFSQFGRMFA